MGGKTYNNALTFYSTRGGASFHNLDRKYTILTAYIGFRDGYSQSHGFHLSFIGDGELLDFYIFPAYEMSKMISVDVTNVRQLQITVEHLRAATGQTAVIAEAILE